MDGTATFNVFELTQAPAMPETSTETFVTRTELEKILEEFKASMI
jgi:hypothetical protein